MILTGKKIQEEVALGRVTIAPFLPAQLSTNSYDLRLGDKYLVYTDEVIDPRRKPACEVRDIPDEGLRLAPGDFVLAQSAEIIGSDHYVPLIHAKSGTARGGLFVHVTADLIDIGANVNTTFQLFATLPIRLHKNMLIAQVTFWVPDGEIELYNGKYQNARGPQPSRTYLDYQ
jgi:dCTP deaminase